MDLHRTELKRPVLDLDYERIADFEVSRRTDAGTLRAGYGEYLWWLLRRVPVTSALQRLAIPAVVACEHAEVATTLGDTRHSVTICWAMDNEYQLWYVDKFLRGLHGSIAAEFCFACTGRSIPIDSAKKSKYRNNMHSWILEIWRSVC